MSDHELPIGLSSPIYDENVMAGLFTSEVLRRGIPGVHTLNWATDVTDFPALMQPVLRIGGAKWRYGLVRYAARGGDDGLPLYISLANGHVTVKIAYRTVAQFVEMVTAVEAAFPKSVIGEKQRVPLTFWALTVHGPRQTTRKIDVPRWGEIEGNYGAATRKMMAYMVRDFRPSDGGQLLLWSGEPGTGKTWALRSLLWEWRKWCRFHYITDPETFFGKESQYLLDVLLAEEEAESEDEDEPNWRVLLLEDTGEIMAADAKERLGQGLSRLLNVVDGMIGQGLRILVMVTTNEQMGKLHPAVARPGRCAYRHEFGKLTTPEAVAWLEARGATMPPGTYGHKSIAELYAQVNGREAHAGQRLMGFLA